MKTLAPLIFSIVVCCQIIVSAQTTNSNFKTYNKDGIKFEYPSNWTFTDNSSSKIQQFYLIKPGNSAVIVISTPKEFLENPKQFSTLQSDAHSKYGNAILKSFSSKDTKSLSQCMDFNGRQVVGTKFTGVFNNEAGSGEVYPFALGNRFLTLVYMKTESEQKSSDIVWQNLIKSIYLEGSNKSVEGIPFYSSLLERAVMNGRAKKLVKPEKFTSANFMKDRIVEVRVLIDKNGKVVSAEAISGNKIFHKEAEAAAKASVFEPTRVCDGIVEVNGIIVYNFIR